LDGFAACGGWFQAKIKLALVLNMTYLLRARLKLNSRVQA